MSSLDASMRAIRSQIQTALQAANLQQRGKVLIGSITPTEWEEIAGQDSGGALVSIYPLSGVSYTDPNPIGYQTITAAAPGTTGTIGGAGNTVLTIGGTPKAGDTVHAFFSGSAGHASYLVQAGDQLQAIATAIAASIDASGIAGVSATALGDAVTMIGAFFEQVNIGGVGSVGAEVARVTRTIQVTVWTSSGNDPVTNSGALDDREAIGEVILANVGTSLTQYIQDASGDFVYVTQLGDSWQDQASDSYTTFKWIILLQVTYSIFSIAATTQLEAVENVVANNIPATIYAR